MLLFDWLRALNQTCFLNFRQYLGLLMLDKRKASHGVHSNQTNSITHSHHPIQLQLLHVLHFSNALLNVVFYHSIELLIPDHQVLKSWEF